MPNYQVAFIFESQQIGAIGTGAAPGWSEVWFKTDPGSLRDVITSGSIDTYIELRTAIMPDIYRIAFVRLSDVDNPHRFKLRAVGASGRGKIPAYVNGILVEQPGQVQCALLIDMEKLPEEAGEVVHHRRFLIRALPSSLINGNVLAPFGPHWIRMTTFMNYVGKRAIGFDFDDKQPTFPWGCRYHDPTQTATAITNAKPDPANDRRLLVEPIIILPAGKKGVEVRRVDSPRNFNKTWTVVGNAPAPNATFMVLEKSREKLQGAYTGPGLANVRAVAWKYGPFDQYVIIGLRNRKTGRVFRQLRGRRSRR